MYLVSTFQYSNLLELAISSIQMKGVPKENILCVPLDKQVQNTRLFDTLHHSDGLTMFDVPMMLAMLFSLFGGIYGFILKWGPILWGIIGIFSGFGLGLIIKLAIAKKNGLRRNTQLVSDVVLIVECSEDQLDMVQDTLWQHNALGVARLNLE